MTLVPSLSDLINRQELSVNLSLCYCTWSRGYRNDGGGAVNIAPELNG